MLIYFILFMCDNLCCAVSFFSLLYFYLWLDFSCSMMFFVVDISLVDWQCVRLYYYYYLVWSCYTLHYIFCFAILSLVLFLFFFLVFSYIIILRVMVFCWFVSIYLILYLYDMLIYVMLCYDMMCCFVCFFWWCGSTMISLVGII